MPIAVAEAVDLVLDRRTVSRADSVDRPAEERGAFEIGAHEVVSARVGARNRAVKLRIDPARAQRRHRPGLCVGSLPLEPRPGDGAAIEPGRSAGLEPSHWQAGLAELPGENGGSLFAPPSTGRALFAAEQHAAEEGAGAEDDPRRLQRSAIGKRHAADPPTLDP